MIIKLLLLLALLGALVTAYRTALDSRSSAIRRLLGGSLFLLGAVTVVHPALLSRVAAFVGVGRGTDLLLYVFVVTSLFVWLGLYRRLHELENKVVMLASDLANAEAVRREDQEQS